MDTVRIRLDFIQFIVTQISIYGFYKSPFFSDSKWFHDHNKPSHEPDTSFPSFKHTVHNHVKYKVQIRRIMNFNIDIAQQIIFWTWIKELAHVCCPSIVSCLLVAPIRANSGINTNDYERLSTPPLDGRLGSSPL